VAYPYDIAALCERIAHITGKCSNDLYILDVGRVRLLGTR
jgi:hypothetical protein